MGRDPETELLGFQCGNGRRQRWREARSFVHQFTSRCMAEQIQKKLSHNATMCALTNLLYLLLISSSIWLLYLTKISSDDLVLHLLQMSSGNLLHL